MPITMRLIEEFEHRRRCSPAVSEVGEGAVLRRPTANRILSEGSVLRLASVLLLLFCACRAGAETLHLGEDVRHVVLDEEFEFLIAPNDLTIRQVASEESADEWRLPEKEKSRERSNDNRIWIRFDVEAAVGGLWILEVGRGMPRHVEVYLQDADADAGTEGMVSGKLFPVKSRPIEHRLILFPVSLSSGMRQSVYLAMDEGTYRHLTLDFWRADEFHRHDQDVAIFIGFFFGALIVMLLYNFCLFLFVKDRAYLAYVAYLLAVIMYQAAGTGLGAQYLWDGSAWFAQAAFLLFAGCVFLTASIFVRSFLSLKEYGGWMLRMTDVFIVIWTILIVIGFFPKVKVLGLLHMIFIGLTLTAGTSVSLILWRKGNIQAKYYVLAYFFLYAGTVILIFFGNGPLSHNLFIENAQEIGFLMEIVLLSIALANRINRERWSREAAQDEALKMSRNAAREREEKMEMQERVLEMQLRTNRELEEKVTERTEELERAMTRLERANKDLSELSVTDPLTRIYNRRYFDMVLERELKRAARNKKPLSIVLFDIDFFKDVNDTHGHLAGDECLRLTATAIQLQLERPADLAARFGGEEFAVILPATPPEKARIVAERIRKVIEGLDIVHSDTHIRITTSAGVAGWIPMPEETGEAFLQESDEALYRAKSEGRNRVCLSCFVPG